MDIHAPHAAAVDAVVVFNQNIPRQKEYIMTRHEMAFASFFCWLEISLEPALRGNWSFATA
jgi:hypothetical protein